MSRYFLLSGRIVFLRSMGIIIISCILFSSFVNGKDRARDLGIPFEGIPGPLNAITDIKGVEVGHSTLMEGEGKGAVRTGITAVLPRGKGEKSLDRVFAGWFSLNGNGEMTGTTWVEESGCLEGPIMITNTNSVGIVRDAVIQWLLEKKIIPETSDYGSLPVVAETWDGKLNDINGFHIKKEHVFHALDNADPGPVKEGNVGGGTGMVAYEFKGGIGTASRKLNGNEGGYSVGVLVQANYGLREQLLVAGVPVGKEITDLKPEINPAPGRHDGSIIIVIATDAPLLPHQLKRVAKRAALGLARNGSIASNSSGDIFIAFSTANADRDSSNDLAHLTMLPNERISPIFTAAVQATEEAIINAMIAAETMIGINGNKVYAVPHERLQLVLKKYNRL